MQPDFQLRLRTMMKALTQVVIPAIDRSNKMAQEQAQLVLGSMEVIRQQVDYAHWYEAADLVSLCNLAEELLAIPGFDAGPSLREARRQALALVSRWDVSLPQLRETSGSLREQIAAAVESAYRLHDEAITTAVSACVMAHAQEQLGRERAFVAGMKWDGYPESLSGIEESLRRAPPLRNAMTS